VAVDPRPSARDLALEAGADVALDSAGLHPGDVLAETRGGAALVLDLVGTDETLSLATHVLAMGGHLSVVGHGGGALPLAVEALPYDSSVGRPSWGTLPELQDVVALARGGALMVEVEVFALGEAIDAYRRLRAGEVTGRAVVVP
jgi:propanol-preferring alcohol dehydrogenase